MKKITNQVILLLNYSSALLKRDACGILNQEPIPKVSSNFAVLRYKINIYSTKQKCYGFSVIPTVKNHKIPQP